MSQNKNTESKNKSVTIIGAGIGGLFSAWELIKSGFSVTIIEKQNSVGGLSTSISEMGYQIDIGPHYVTLPKSSEISNTIFELMGDDIFEVPEIKNWYKSYFHGKFINGFPTLYDAIYSENIKSIFQSILSLISSKFLSKKTENVEKYLISLYGNFLYETWCKPYILQTIGHLDIPLEYAKKKFKPITLSKIIKKFFSNKNNKLEIQTNEVFNFSEYYFKFGIGHLAKILTKKILDANGKIILNANIQSITHQKEIKNIYYSSDNNSFNHETDIIIYATPMQITKTWFSINEELPKNNNFHSIIVILFVDSPKIFDGWVLGIFDNETPYFRIAQQTYLSKHVAPPGKSLLSLEIRSHDDDPLWKQDSKITSKQIEQSLRNIGLLKNEKVDGSKVIKLRNVYPNIFQNSASKSDNIDFLKSIKNEYILGTKEMDSGRLVSNDDQTNNSVSLGGIFTSLQESKDLIKKIISIN